MAGTFNGGATSSGDAGSSAAPLAGATVCSVTNCNGPWFYEINVVTYQTGTVDANGANMQLMHGTSVVSLLLSTSVESKQVFRVLVASGETVAVKVVANAGAGSIYNASISVTRVAYQYHT